MDLPPEELQFLTIPDVVKESISIPKRSAKTFYLITLTLIFPLSFAILAHSLFTHPIFVQLRENPHADHADHVFRRLFITFVWVSLLMLVYNVVFVGFLVLLIIAVDTESVVLFLFSVVVLFLLFLVVHVYITALWHLASVISVLEPVYGLAAMKKSYELLRGRARMAFVLVFSYLTICGVISGFFGLIVVNGGDYYSILSRILVGGFLVGVLVIVNLVGLLVQSVFYYVCKSYHNQGIDKSALYDHLGGYLGEYVPLKSSIQMENLDDET
nr:uncharacterized protein LOC109165782 [Ipomoea batatas]GMD10345.1 uncharacterized protein LOC109165782 [Ipomoea batatas]GMD11701.1 uncharacterized protein LOC109165782 [Ipomoea batatas]